MHQHLFFDLDHTLWDFEANAEETLFELFDQFEVRQYSSVSKKDFAQIYQEINDRLWALYRDNQIDKQHLRTQRFIDTFLRIGYPEQKIPVDIWERYLEICPTKTNLIEGTHDVLSYLAGNYRLHLITNGFTETQKRKIKHSDLERYFDTMTTSEEVGAQKPSPVIFREALRNAKCSQTASSFVGDNFEADVKGALNSGWDMYWYAPTKELSKDQLHPQLTKINKLVELKQHF